MRESATTEHELKKKQPVEKRASGTEFGPKIKSKIMAKWNKISESDVDAMNGNLSLLSAKIQDLYSYPKVKAEKECDEFRKANKLE